MRDWRPHVSSLHASAVPLTGHALPRYAANFVSTVVRPQASTLAMPVEGAVQAYHRSWAIAIEPIARHALSAWPCVPVVARALLNANVPVPEIAVGVLQSSFGGGGGGTLIENVPEKPPPPPNVPISR